MPAPDLLKKMTVLQYLADYRCASFIETGTYFGQTTQLVADTGVLVKTIELSAELHARAQEKFADRANVTCLHGDSGELIRDAIKDVPEPCLFWLDGHFSAGPTAHGEIETPILRELLHIFAWSPRRSVILIDDIRCFGVGDYPPVSFVTDLISQYLPRYQITIANDILRATPPAPG